jgi:poly(A) polymerase
MPVITPAYPSMCSTFNITRSTMTVIQKELKRGLELSEGILAGKAPWKDLFVKHKFFTAGYKYYICVVATSKTKEAHKVWSGYVESKVRMLVQRIETHASIALAHPFTKGFERRHLCTTDEEIAQVQEGSLDFVTTDPEEPDISHPKTEAVKYEASQASNGTIKPENGTESDIKKEGEEDATAQVNGTSSSQQDQASAIKTETEAEAEAALEPPKPRIIYTTTHYIGLELAEGMFYPANPRRSDDCIGLLVVLSL